MDERQVRLQQVIQRYANEPFQWGVNDCCTFAAKVVLAFTGEDPLRFVPEYHDEVSAASTVASLGGLEAFLDRLFGDGCSQPAPMSVGDIVLCRMQGIDYCGVWMGEDAIIKGKLQVVRVPRKTIYRSWPVWLKQLSL